MRHSLRGLALLLSLLVSAACASGRPGDGGTRDPRVITKEQIRERHFLTAYEAVQAMRPNWLETRGTDSFANPTKVLVYYDHARLGGIDELRNLKSDIIEFIRYYNGTEATNRWGLDHGAGVIFVSSHPNGAL